MRKMLIVGGAGYIGGVLTDIFMNNPDYDITVYDNLLYELRYLKNIKFIYGDIRDRKTLGKIINDYDTVIWLAAIVGDGACAVKDSLTEEINFSSVKWFVDTYTSGKIIFMSTCSVYGTNSEFVDEDSKTNPLSSYAETKLRAEKYVMKNAKDYLIFRLGTLYGLGDEHTRLRFDLVVNIFVLRAVMGEGLTVFGGQQWRPILHVRDVANAIEFAIDNDISGLYNLSEQNVEISTLAQEIKNFLPLTAIVFQDMQYEDLRDYKVSDAKIRSKGWSPKLSLNAGIEEMIKVFEENRVSDIYNAVYYNVDHINKLSKKGKI